MKMNYDDYRLTNTRILERICNKLKTPEIVIPVAVTFLTVLAVWLLVKNSFTVWPGDATAYWEMAQIPISPDTKWVFAGIPYIYRILIPSIVRIIFGSSINGFIFIGIVSLLISNYLVFKISQVYTDDILASLFIVVAFSSNYTVVFTLANICMLDIPSFVFALLLVLIFVKHLNIEGDKAKLSWFLFSLLLILGTLVKEWFLFLIPIFIVYLLCKHKIRESVFTGFCSLPAIVAHLIIRLMVGPLFDKIHNSFDIFMLIGPYMAFEIGQYRQLISTFGALWLFIPLSLIYCYKKNRILKEVYILPILGLIAGLIMSCMAAEENRYLFFICYPFLIPAFSIYFSELNRHIQKSALYTITALFFLTRLALTYRPVFTEGTFWPFAHLMQNPNFLLFISVVAAFQILIIVYYIAAASGKTSLPGAIKKVGVH